MDGAQLIGKAAAVLRAVSGAMPEGATTADLVRITALSRTTVQRVLLALLEEGMLDRDVHRGRWALGPDLYLMGTSAAARYDVRNEARDAVRALAELTGESAFFSARRGDESVCLLQEDGSFPLRSHVLHEGVRFPLGVASAGLVLLAHQPLADIEAYIDTHGGDLELHYGESHSAASLRRRVAATRRNGFAVNPGLVVPGSWGMAAAVFDSTGLPAWALTLTGVETRFTAQRRQEMGELLLSEAHRVTTRLGGRGNRVRRV